MAICHLFWLTLFFSKTLNVSKAQKQNETEQTARLRKRYFMKRLTEVTCYV